MKRTILLLITLSTLLLTGCGIYGKGETEGYVYAIDDGLIWDKVWYKSSLESSESDCYLIKDDVIKQQLRAISSDTRIKLKYDRHFQTASLCPDGTSTNDEITSFEIIQGE